MPAPTIIAGPAVVKRGSNVWYTEGDIEVALVRETAKRQTSMFGEIDEFLVSQMLDITFTPVGAIDTVAKYLPFALSQIGTLLFDNTATEILTKAGKKITYHNTAVTQLPGFTLAAIKPLIGGAMKITALGDGTKELTNAAAFNTYAAQAFSEATFDQTKLVSPRFTAAWGAEFTGMESEDGFNFDIGMTAEFKKVANFGAVNAILTGLTGRCRFIPAVGDEDAQWTRARLQGADAILPGESLSKMSQDLVITAGAVSFTLHKAGPANAKVRYGLQPLRNGEIEFVGRKTWASGVINPLFTVAFA